MSKIILHRGPIGDLERITGKPYEFLMNDKDIIEIDTKNVPGRRAYKREEADRWLTQRANKLDLGVDAVVNVIYIPSYDTHDLINSEGL